MSRLSIGTKYNLGVMYESGRGVSRDYGKAVFWFLGAVGDDAEKKLQQNLARLSRKRVSANIANIRSGGSTHHDVIFQMPRGEKVYILDTQSGWYQVIFGYGLVGWMSASVLEDIPDIHPVSKNDLFPAIPVTKLGYITCNTRCVNGDCYRTYSDGSQMHFQAVQRFNALTRQWEWDSGSC